VKKYPKKEAICKLAHENAVLAIGLYSLNTESDLGAKIADSLPEFFSDTPSAGPIPLSWIRKFKHKDSEGMHDAVEGAKHYQIPHFMFALDEHTAKDSGHPLIPNDAWRSLQPGDTFEYNGATFVVLLQDCGWLMDFVPAQYVDPTC
jgi:hypothetical protein